MKTISSFSGIFMLVFALFTAPAYGQDPDARLKTLEDTVQKQGSALEEQQKTIDTLRRDLETRPSPQSAGNEAAAPASRGSSGGSSLTSPNISLILDTFVYSSNLKNEELEARAIPGYTNLGLERRKGFNLEAAELFFFAPVDPYFNLYVTIPVSEEEVELEEAYFVTTSLPAGLQVKGGKFKSGFGRLNGQHPHVWNFADAPLPYRVFVGDEGIVEKGLQMTYLPALSFYLQLGIEALQGDNEILFGPEAKDGPHAFAGFVKASFDLGDDTTLLLGQSVAAGKANTETVADDTIFSGDSTLFGTELTWKWKPSRERSFMLQSEYLLRKQKGDLENTSVPSLDPFRRGQDGLYAQAIYRFGRWAAGARYDVLDLATKENELAGVQQDSGAKPWRTTGSIEHNPTEFSRIRLQYNHDESARNERINREIFLQFTMGIGAHAAHAF